MTNFQPASLVSLDSTNNRFRPRQEPWSILGDRPQDRVSYVGGSHTHATGDGNDPIRVFRYLTRSKY